MRCRPIQSPIFRSVPILLILTTSAGAQASFGISGGLGISRANDLAAPVIRVSGDGSLGHAALTLRYSEVAPDQGRIQDYSALIGFRTGSHMVTLGSGAGTPIIYASVSAGITAIRLEPGCLGPCAAESSSGAAYEITGRIAYPHVALGAALGGTHANQRTSWVGLSLFLSIGRFQ
jgi:hypothetical protein